MSKHAFHIREFLNSEQGIALIEATVDNRDGYLDGNICLGDCNRQIYLSFSPNIDDEEDILEIQRKLHSLIEHLQNFEKVFLEQIPLAREMRAKALKERDERKKQLRDRYVKVEDLDDELERQDFEKAHT